MSEKIVRETLEALADDYRKDNYNDMILSAIMGALDEDTDVVVLLRWLKTNQQTEERYLSEKRRRAEYDTHHRQGARNAFRDTIVTIEQSFGVRLTDKGYEWTEEDENDGQEVG